MYLVKLFVGQVITVLVLFLFCTSCLSSRQVAYFNRIADTTLHSPNEDLEPVIQKGDVLSISVSSLTPEVAVVFNSPNVPAANAASASVAANLSQAVGYLVNQDGYIQFPMLGNLKVAGLSKKMLKDQITQALQERKLLFDPIVSIRYLNFHVTVIGEVGRPGLITIPGEQVSILEAIGLAGDLTIYGKRENVMLIRKENNQKIVRRLDLTSTKLLSSPYFYLKSNDVIYIEPNKDKIASVSQSRQMLPAVLSGLSFLAIVIDRLIR